MDPTDAQYENFVVAEWQNAYVDRQALESAFAPMRGKELVDELRSDPFDEADLVRVEKSLMEVNKLSESAESLDDDTALAVKRAPKQSISELKNRRVDESTALIGAVEISEAVSCARGTEQQQQQFDRALTLFVENANKASNFYEDRLSDLKENFSMLVQAWNRRTRGLDGIDVSAVAARYTEHDREGESIRRAMIDVYRHLKFLESYVGLNYSVLFTVAREVSGSLVQYLESRSISRTEALDDFEQEIERTFADLFFYGNKVQARTALLLKQTKQVHKHELSFGVFIGICITMFFWLIWDAIIDNSRLWKSGTIVNTAAFPVFRGVLCFILLMWSWGISCYVWTRYRVNYIFMFEIDPRWLPSVTEVFSEAIRATVVYFVTFLLYFKTVLGTFPEWIRPGIYPLVLVIYMLYKMSTPNKFTRHLYKTAVIVCLSPLTKVTFFSIFLGDWLTSLVKAEVDIAYSVCYFGAGVFLREETGGGRAIRAENICSDNFWMDLVAVPVLCAFPLWLRFMQCLRRARDSQERYPNLPNAAKYSLAMLVVLLGAFHPFDKTRKSELLLSVWIATFFVSGLMSFWWDVRMDWGLGRQKYGYLSDKLMYPKRSLYYTAIGLDLFLRFSWLLTLLNPITTRAVLGISQLPDSTVFHVIQTVLQVTEVIRRTMWGFFRLENEHLHNSLHFRRSNFIPLHFESVYGEEKESDEKSSSEGVHAVELFLLAGFVVVVAAIIIVSRFFMGI